MLYETVPKFSRKPIFSYQSGVIAFVLLGIILIAASKLTQTLSNLLD
jgi:cytochrome c oxidase subunit I